MPEHAHLLIRPRRPEYDIASIRKAIKEPVGRKAIRYLAAHAPHWLPKVTRIRGGRIERLFWQPGGGYDRNVYRIRTALASARYINANPVRRKLVACELDWRWSSARNHAGLGDGPILLDPIE